MIILNPKKTWVIKIALNAIYYYYYYYYLKYFFKFITAGKFLSNHENEQNKKGVDSIGF